LLTAGDVAVFLAYPKEPPYPPIRKDAEEIEPSNKKTENPSPPV